MLTALFLKILPFLTEHAPWVAELVVGGVVKAVVGEKPVGQRKPLRRRYDGPWRGFEVNSRTFRLHSLMNISCAMLLPMS
jgi:hypothetical protein